MTTHGVEEEWDRYVDPPNNPGLYRACWSSPSGTEIAGNQGKVLGSRESQLRFTLGRVNPRVGA